MVLQGVVDKRGNKPPEKVLQGVLVEDAQVVEQRPRLLFAAAFLAKLAPEDSGERVIVKAFPFPPVSRVDACIDDCIRP